MDKAEKALAKKLLAVYKGSSKSDDFTREEELILERWRVHKMLNSQQGPAWKSVKIDENSETIGHVVCKKHRSCRRLFVA